MSFPVLSTKLQKKQSLKKSFSFYARENNFLTKKYAIYQKIKAYPMLGTAIKNDWHRLTAIERNSNAEGGVRVDNPVCAVILTDAKMIKTFRGWKLCLYERHFKAIGYKYSVRRLIGSLWANIKVTTLHEWSSELTFSVCCLGIGPAISYYNKGPFK